MSTTTPARPEGSHDPSPHAQQEPPQQGPDQPSAQPWVPAGAAAPTAWGYPVPTTPLPPTPGHGAGAAFGGPPPSSAPGYPPPTPAAPSRRPRTWLAVATAAVLAAGLATGGTAAVMSVSDEPAAQSQVLTQNDGSGVVAVGEPDWQAVSDAVRPSVVAIQVSTAQGQGAGSGVVLDTTGHVLTNNHVVAGATSVSVTLWDGRIYEADVVGTDPTTDLAVLQLTDPPQDLVAATLGTSDDVAVGEPVMAVGNPLGLDSTVTTGIVSALDRPVSASAQDGSSAQVTNAIQIDAAINPGNSGGPLFDSEGMVIGITSSIATLSGGESGSIGLGFAIPVDLATTIADQLISSGTAEHAFLGVTLTDQVATADGVTRAGAEVVEVSDGTPAAEAGLQPGDVIVGIDDRTVAGAESLTGYVRQYVSGDQVDLTVVRDGQSIQVAVTLATREEE